MEAEQFEVLAGRIEGMGRAVLHLAAALETRRLIDGPQLSRWWREAAAPRGDDAALRQAAQGVLHDLARALDDARGARESRNCELCAPSVFERRGLLH